MLKSFREDRRNNLYTKNATQKNAQISSMTSLSVWTRLTTNTGRGSEKCHVIKETRDLFDSHH